MSTLATTVAVSGDYSRRKWQQMYTLYIVFSTATIVVEIGESVDRALIVNNIISKTRFQFSSFQSMLQLLPRRLWSQYGPTPKGSQQLFAYEKDSQLGFVQDRLLFPSYSFEKSNEFTRSECKDDNENASTKEK